MKRFFITIAATALIAGTAQAQVRQSSVGGETGDPVYSLRVTGTDGQVYKCKPEIVTENGVRKRICLPDDDDATPLFASGDGISGAAPALAIGLVAIAIAGGGGDGATSTSTTGAAASQ